MYWIHERCQPTIRNALGGYCLSTVDKLAARLGARAGTDFRRIGRVGRIGALESAFFGRATVEPLVIAMLAGMIVRATRGVDPRAEPGIRFFSKEVLEAAVLLLGASMDVPRLFASGPRLAAGIAALVCAALACGYLIGRATGLSTKLAVLVACGNAICGNSAIAAVAPVICSRS